MPIDCRWYVSHQDIPAEHLQLENMQSSSRDVLRCNGNYLMNEIVFEDVGRQMVEIYRIHWVVDAIAFKWNCVHF